MSLKASYDMTWRAINVWLYEQGYSIRGREAWSKDPPGGGGGAGTPGPADYVARLQATAPAYTMAGRWPSAAAPDADGVDAPGPGEYQPSDSAGGGGPSFTFGHRTLGGGAAGHPADGAAAPGPGAYDIGTSDAAAAEGRGYSMAGGASLVPSLLARGGTSDAV